MNRAIGLAGYTSGRVAQVIHRGGLPVSAAHGLQATRLRAEAPYGAQARATRV